MTKTKTIKATGPSVFAGDAERRARRGWSVIGAILAGLSLGLTPAALAQNNPPPASPPPSPEPEVIPVGIGILNATSYHPIAKGTGFDTVIRNPTDPTGSALDNAVLDRVNQELAARGYRVDHEAQLVMLVGGDLVRGSSKDAVVDELRGITPPTKQGNVFSTNGNTLLTRIPPDPHPNIFRISLSVYDRQTGTYVWRGAMDRGTSNLTPDQATDRMVPPLVGAIGQTEKERKVDIGTTQ